MTGKGVIEAWAIKAPDGDILEVSMHKSTLIDSLFDAPSDYLFAMEEGHKIVKVHIAGAQE